MNNPFDVSGGNERKWNYSDSQKPDYRPEISGTVVEIERYQSIGFNTKEREWWQDENPSNWNVQKNSYDPKPVPESKLVPNGKTALPVVSFRLIIKEQSGSEKEWVFNPKSFGQDALVKALGGDTDISKALGHWLTIRTPGMTGGPKGGTARVWEVSDGGMGDQASVRGCVDNCPPPREMPLISLGGAAAPPIQPGTNTYYQAPQTQLQQPQQLYQQDNPYAQQQPQQPQQPQQQGNPYAQQQVQQPQQQTYQVPDVQPLDQPPYDDVPW